MSKDPCFLRSISMSLRSRLKDLHRALLWNVYFEGFGEKSKTYQPEYANFPYKRFYVRKETHPPHNVLDKTPSQTKKMDMAPDCATDQIRSYINYLLRNYTQYRGTTLKPLVANDFLKRYGVIRLDKDGGNVLMHKTSYIKEVESHTAAVLHGSVVYTKCASTEGSDVEFWYTLGFM